LLVSIGGDGTLLQAARLAAQHDVPVLGINRGRLGFLTDVPPQDMAASIDAVIDGSLRCRPPLAPRGALIRVNGT
jgi:NAD+ kinase